MPLRLTPEQREQLITRLVLQPPRNEADRRAFLRVKTSIPNDVLLTLESLRLLADQGNRLAGMVFESECRRMGLWYEQRWFGPTS